MIKKCEKCNKLLQFLDNPKNDLTYLICPKCHDIDTSEKYVTIEQRIEQGYSRYERAEEKLAYSLREKFIENDEF